MTNTGGHNILEPVWVGTPVVFGPDTRNIDDLVDYIISLYYGVRVRDPAELAQLIRQTPSATRTLQINTQPAPRPPPLPRVAP